MATAEIEKKLALSWQLTRKRVLAPVCVNTDRPVSPHSACTPAHGFIKTTSAGIQWTRRKLNPVLLDTHPSLYYFIRCLPETPKFLSVRRTTAKDAFESSR